MGQRQVAGQATGEDRGTGGRQQRRHGPGRLSHGGSGITGMRERAAVLGGELSAGFRPGGGFRVSARLPAGPAP